MPSPIGNLNFSPFLDVNISSALSLRAWISDASNCPSSSISATNAYSRNISGKTFLPNSWSLDWSFTEIGNYSTKFSERNDQSLKWFSKSSLTKCSSICKEVLDSQMATAFHRISPPLFVQARLKQLTLFPQYHLSRIEVLKCCDSMESLHKIFLIPTNCLYQ